MKNLHKILFLHSMMLGTLMSISTMSWLTAWLGLEINLLSIMPLMKTPKNMYSSEAMIKYFITQVMASSMFLFSIIIFLNMNLNLYKFPSILINSAFLLKLGAAPFHFWLPEVIGGLSWNIVFLMFTWQKIAPSILLSYCMKSPLFISIIIIMSSLISSLQGINQLCLRKILTFSSINHMSWMMGALLTSMKIWVYYIIIYSIINLNIIIILNHHKIYFYSQLFKLFSFNKTLKYFFMMNFLSLGGLPPFLGFFPKWITINFMVNNHFFVLSSILIVSTLLTLFFYLRITFSSFTLNSEESSTNLMTKMPNFMIFFFNAMSLFSLPFCFTLTSYM